jgi:hypothetical protein
MQSIFDWVVSFGFFIFGALTLYLRPGQDVRDRPRYGKPTAPLRPRIRTMWRGDQAHITVCTPRGAA